MNIGIKKKKQINNSKNWHIRFCSLLITTSVLLALLFQTVYIDLNIRKLKLHVNSIEAQISETNHSYLSANFKECMIETDMLQTFILRNQLTEFVKRNLNLVDRAESEKVTGRTSETLQMLSVSGQVISDFILFGKDVNQKNLYCDIKERELNNTPLPSVELLTKAGLDGMLHTNMGYMAYCDKPETNSAQMSFMTDIELAAVENLIEYLSGAYYICDYINGTLFIVRFNPEYVENKLIPASNSKFIVYSSLNQPVLYFNTDKVYADSLSEHLDMNDTYYENEDYCYNISSNLYGTLTVVTETEKNNSFFTVAESGYIYIIFTCVSVLISLFFSMFFAGQINKKLGTLLFHINTQTKLNDFSFMKFDEIKHRWKKLTLSKNVLFSLIGSCIVPLFLVTIAFYGIVERETKELATAHVEALSHNYANQCETYYERYNSLSTVKIEQLLNEYQSNYSMATSHANLELIQKFENDFYYDTTFLPGYSYAFIVDEKDTVIYQTSFSSQIRLSDNLIQQAFSSFKKMEVTSAFVPVNDLISGDEALAFVKKIEGTGKKGTLVIVFDVPKLEIGDVNRLMLADSFIVDADNHIILENGFSLDEVSQNSNLLYAVEDSMLSRLGKSVVYMDYSFYLNQIREAQYLNIIWMIFAGVLCIVVAFLLYRILLKPFNILIKNMNIVPEMGYATITERFAIDEVDTIAIAYNQMIARLVEMVEVSVKKENERKDLELLQSQTEFKMLEQQINPHFLFNTLEIINLSAMNNGEEDISKIVKALSFVLRYAINQSSITKVRQEIKALQSYIEIQRFRFGDKISIKLQLDETLLDLNMIKFILQPLVENAISHGFRKNAKAGTILISLSCYDSGMEFKIKDDGVGMSEEALHELRDTIYNATEGTGAKTRGGIGLPNVYRRIALYYQGKGQFIINSAEGVGTEVIVRLPFEL